MRLGLCFIGFIALAAAGCFPQKAPHRPLTAVTLEKAAELAATLEFLDLHGKPIDGLPADMSPFTSLSQVSLRKTGLSTLPDALKTITGPMTWLDLGDNKIAAFPDPALLARVKTLYLSDNALTELPASIGSLSQLTYLNLDRNQIAALPPEIGNLQSLAYLRLNGNKLTAIPDSIAQLKALKRLYLKGNPLPESEKVRLKNLLPQTDLLF
jgi:leucine-rich repeat protein SHOC2